MACHPILRSKTSLCCNHYRLVLAKREAKAVTEHDTELLDYWYECENDFEIISFKAWNKTIIQVRMLPS